MVGHDLRHLAVIAAAQPAPGGEARAALLASCAKAGEIARAAFGAVPGLQAFSWVAPGVDRLLARASDASADRACADGAILLGAVAAELGVALRPCGRAVELPRAAAVSRAAAGGRTLLWFRRYGGRDEIVRAATRFFAAHPGRQLADEDLGRWLDTAGVPDPDLLLFAGGALEPQDALLWQGSYAEIWHTPAPWSALTEADVRNAVAAFVKRQRRFGR